MLKFEIDAYTKWAGYTWFHKWPLHIEGISAINGISDYTLYTYISSDLYELIGTKLKRGDILIISSIDSRYSQNEYFYINEDHSYTDLDIWNPSFDIFIPIEALDGTPINHIMTEKKYQEMMNYVKDIENVPILDRYLLGSIIGNHGISSLVRCAIDDDHFKVYPIKYVFGNGGIGRSYDDTIDKYVTSGHKGEILVVTYYTGYGWTPNFNNTLLYVGIMDVSKQEAEKQGLKFHDMYKEFRLKDK